MVPPLGQLASLTDAENQTTSYTYDARGLKLTETYPDHTGGSTVGQTGYGIVTFVYDNAGRVLRKQDQLGVTLTHSYDLAGRMNRRDYRTAANSPSGTIADSDTFTFDRASRMRTAVNGRYTNTVTYTYDPVGRKATEALTISNVTYTTGQAYNARNELTTITYPNNTTSTRSYHPTGTLNQLRLDGSTVSTRSYDAGRRQTTEVLSNGITETRTYRNDNLLSAINYSNTSLGNMAYTWDANKNKTSESITGVMSGYGFTSAGTTYDFEDRLTGFSRAATSGPALLSQSWNLTTVGDWTSVTTNGTAQNRTHGPTHELLTAGGQNVATDVKGNITTLPANLRPTGATTALNLTWDSDNKLRSADIDANGTADVNFQYDALGRRVARTGTGGSVVFVQMDQQTIADYPVGGAATTPTFRYVYASYIDEPVVRKGPTSTSTAHFYHRNHQYSITAVTTSTGSIAERYAYTAYGQPTVLDASAFVLSSSAINNRYTYTGREWDATLGLHHFRARWMSPIAGRFLTRDPIGYRSQRNLYCGINVRGLDPTGNRIVVGHTPEGYPIYQYEPGDPIAPPSGNGPHTYCYTMTQYGPVWDVCPDPPVNIEPTFVWNGEPECLDLCKRRGADPKIVATGGGIFTYPDKNGCCKKCVCVFNIPSAGLDWNKCPELAKCAMKHESSHLSDTKCDLTNPRPPFATGIDQLKRECELRKADIACIKSVLSNSPSNDCTSVGNAWLRIIEPFVLTQCK
jgi:RHS repeat-associated protein